MLSNAIVPAYVPRLGIVHPRRMSSDLKYRGNAGNLLQHWVLCELIRACNKHWTSIHFVDAYAMAPLATQQIEPGPSLFTHAQNRKTPDSGYETAWRHLVMGQIGYPNSAAFVAELWNGTVAMSLSDNDKPTALALNSWADTQNARTVGADVKVWPDDWRLSFNERVANTKGVTVLSFDPDKFTLQNPSSGRDMTLVDIEIVGAALAQLSGECVIQLSTYSSARGLNPQEEVERAIAEGFGSAGLRLLAVARVSKEMMSMVIGKESSPVASELVEIADSFDSWFESLDFSWELERFRRNPDNAGKLPPLRPSRRKPQDRQK